MSERETTEEEVSAATELLDSIDTSLAAMHSVFLSTENAIRYVRATGGNMKKSKEMLEATLKWRNEAQPHLISPVDVEHQALTGKMYVHGQDKHGRPIVIMRPAFENSGDREHKLKHFIFHMEQACADAGSLGKLVWIVDFRGYAMMSKYGMDSGTGRATLNLLQSHYPERLHKAFLIAPPFAIRAFLAMIRPFIDSATKDKLVVVKETNAEKLKDFLGEHIDASHLQADMGGDSEFEYVHDRYWSDVSDKYDERRSVHRQRRSTITRDRLASAASVPDEDAQTPGEGKDDHDGDDEKNGKEDDKGSDKEQDEQQAKDEQEKQEQEGDHGDSESDFESYSSSDDSEEEVTASKRQRSSKDSSSSYDDSDDDEDGNDEPASKRAHRTQ